MYVWIQNRHTVFQIFLVVCLRNKSAAGQWVHSSTIWMTGRASKNNLSTVTLLFNWISSVHTVTLNLRVSGVYLLYIPQSSLILSIYFLVSCCRRLLFARSSSLCVDLTDGWPNPLLMRRRFPCVYIEKQRVLSQPTMQEKYVSICSCCRRSPICR